MARQSGEALANLPRSLAPGAPRAGHSLDHGLVRGCAQCQLEGKWGWASVCRGTNPSRVMGEQSSVVRLVAHGDRSCARAAQLAVLLCGHCSPARRVRPRGTHLPARHACSSLRVCTCQRRPQACRMRYTRTGCWGDAVGCQRVKTGRGQRSKRPRTRAAGAIVIKPAQLPAACAAPSGARRWAAAPQIQTHTTPAPHGSLRG